jgi:hypothetical protein
MKEVTHKILKEFSPKAVKMLTIIFNAVLRIKYFPVSWKIACHTITKTKKKVVTYQHHIGRYASSPNI